MPIKTVIDDLLDKIAVELDSAEKSVLKIGALLNEAKALLNYNNKLLHNFREARFGGRLDQRTANNYMAVAEVFHDGLRPGIGLTGHYILASKSNRDYRDDALLILEGKKSSVEDVKHAVKVAKGGVDHEDQADHETTSTSPPQKPIFSRKLEAIFKEVDLLSEEDKKMVVIMAAQRCNVKVYLDFTPYFDDMGRHLDLIPTRNDDETEKMPPDYVIVPVEDSDEYQRIHRGEILSMDNIGSEIISRT